MLIKQISTLPSSPSAGDNGGNQETSSRIRQGNPNPPTTTTTPPPSSRTNPRPEVDEETLRHLDKILRSIPRELDGAAAYAELKARLGISWSKNPASSSRTNILPKSPTSPPKTISPIQTLPLSPLPSPPISPPPSTDQTPSSSPIHPMQCSESSSDEEAFGVNYGQPFAVPSPTSGGVPTSIHEPHLTEDGNITNEGEEEFRPLFDYGENDKKEEEPLRRQTRCMTMDKLLEKVEGLKTRGERETIVQRPRTERRLVDEEEPDEPQIQEAGEEREAATSSLAREERERKRKGKESVIPTSERSRPANIGVVIEDAPAPFFLTAKK